MLKRRQFVAGSAAAVGFSTASLSATVLAKEAARCAITPFSQGFCKSSFEQLAGETFTLLSDNGQVAKLKALSVIDEGSTKQLEQFSIQFESAALDQALSDDVYTLEHGQAGECQMFLTAAGTGSYCKQRYTASFSLLS